MDTVSYSEKDKRFDDVFVVVRSIGERTEAATLASLALQLPPDQIRVIREYPFVKALQESYRAALAAGRRWTICVDADMLVRTTAVARIAAIARRFDTGVFVFNMQVLDKLFGGPRYGGAHVYQTVHLARAMQYTVNQEFTNRPETYVMRHMEQEGYAIPIVDDVIGVHDFEQYYHDIFRTAYMHARKHRGKMAYLKSYWERMSQADADFVAALAGFRYSNRAIVADPLDARGYTAAAAELAAYGITAEKKPLAPAATKAEKIEKIITQSIPPKEYYLAKRYAAGQIRFPYRPLMAEAAHVRREHGWGGLLAKLGDKLLG